MAADDVAVILDSDLPLVRRELPWPVRVLMLGAGLFVIVVPVWELGPGLWPPNIAMPVFAIIIMGAFSVGIRMIQAGLSDWGEHWSYPAGSIEVRRRDWGRVAITRLSSTNVEAVEVRRHEDADRDEQWQVVVLPKPVFSGLAAKAGPGGVFNAGTFASQAYAERVRRALLQHLHL